MTKDRFLMEWNSGQKIFLMSTDRSRRLCIAGDSKDFPSGELYNLFL